MAELPRVNAVGTYVAGVWGSRPEAPHDLSSGQPRRRDGAAPRAGRSSGYWRLLIFQIDPVGIEQTKAVSPSGLNRMHVGVFSPCTTAGSKR